MSDEERVALAVAALGEVTDPGDVGPLVDVVVPEPGVVDLRFATTTPGYPGWFWTVSTSALEGVEPTVLELELVPGEGALLAPPWVPWTDRLAEWRRSHAEGAEDGPAGEDADGLEDDLDEDGSDEDLDDDADADDDDADDDDADDELDEEDLDLEDDEDGLDDGIDVEAAEDGAGEDAADDAAVDGSDRA